MDAKLTTVQYPLFSLISESSGTEGNRLLYSDRICDTLCLRYPSSEKNLQWYSSREIFEFYAFVALGNRVSSLIRFLHASSIRFYNSIRSRLCLLLPKAE